MLGLVSKQAWLSYAAPVGDLTIPSSVKDVAVRRARPDEPRSTLTGTGGRNMIEAQDPLSRRNP